MKLRKDILKLRNPQKALTLQKYFKTGPGEYGEGDIFYGLTASQSHALVRKYSDLSLAEIQELIYSRVHEERLIGLSILVQQYQKNDPKAQKEIYRFYMKHLRQVNNWDLVDSTAPLIVGPYLFNRDRSVLFKMAKSKNLWRRRVAMMSCFYFIRQNDYWDALKIAQILLNDEHDLIHKAVGWMLREIGKRAPAAETQFLNKFATQMPRTMLRYAIEKFPEKQRQFYLKLK